MKDLMNFRKDEIVQQSSSEESDGCQEENKSTPDSDRIEPKKEKRENSVEDAYQLVDTVEKKMY